MVFVQLEEGFFTVIAQKKEAEPIILNRRQYYSTAQSNDQKQF
jgi:hypothetical protein